MSGSTARLQAIGAIKDMSRLKRCSGRKKSQEKSSARMSSQRP